MILDIPCHLYQSNTQIGPALIQLMYDHDFYERYKNNPINNDSSGLHVTN